MEFNKNNTYQVRRRRQVCCEIVDRVRDQVSDKVYTQVLWNQDKVYNQTSQVADQVFDQVWDVLQQFRSQVWSQLKEKYK